MKWLSLGDIKAQLRMESSFTLEDDLLTMYGESAEESVLAICRRTYEDLIEEYGGMPKQLVHASLLLVSLSYQYREAVAPNNLYAVPYSFELMVKPFMRLSGGDEDADSYAQPTLGSDVKIVFTANLPDGLKLIDVDFKATAYNDWKKDVKVVFNKADCHAIGDGTNYLVMFNSNQLGVGKYMLKLEMDVPDNDYESGYSKEVVRIDPKIYVKG